MQYERIFPDKTEMSVYAGHNTLTCSLFVASSPIYLPGKKQSRNSLHFEAGRKLKRIEIIILHGVCRTENTSIFHPFNRVKSVNLNFQRKRRGKTL